MKKMLPKPKKVEWCKCDETEGDNPECPRHGKLKKEDQEATEEGEEHFAEGGSVPEPDPDKAAQMQKGATESGYQPTTWMKNIKEGLGMADGGEVGPIDLDADADDVDNEILDSCAGELLDAIERKDKGQILEAIRAIVLSTR
jgi:hypothetical protein